MVLALIVLTTVAVMPAQRADNGLLRALPHAVEVALRSVSRTDSTLTLVIAGMVTREFAPDSSEVLSIGYELKYRERPDGDVSLARWREAGRGPVTARAVPVRVRRR